MLEQIDHRGKRFTIDDVGTVDEANADGCRRVDALERQAQRELCELERARAVAGPAGMNPDVEVLER
ncbi:hypothetical protein [Natrialba sp. INN-245]|uniref:hypothetical protein n=1 Tax=Natrialba sp. INN-245 TaxID=2690967 RepID=UPI0013124B15|nr:hypothetical protein [Natrialba sp. INN-245]MWV38860.1 hypothetical protein [Natrialba sp. INN-245]